VPGLAKTCFIIISLVIMLSPTPLIPKQASFALSSYLTILGYSNFSDSAGYVHVVGEVQNTSPTPQDSISITATVYDSAHNEIGSSFGLAAIDNLRPGEKSPFDVIVGDTSQVGSAANYNLTVSSSVATEKPAELNLKISGHLIDNASNYHLIGTVTNQGSSNATNVKVAAAFYNNEGKIEDVSFTFVNGTNIGPLKSAQFEMVVSDGRLDISYASVNAQSDQYSMINSQLSGLSFQQMPASISPLAITDLQNIPVTIMHAGSTVLLGTTITTNDSSMAQQSFVMVFEEDSANGVTAGLQVQKGMLNAGLSSSDVGVSWQPSDAGTYTIRIMVLSSLKAPSLLSVPDVQSALVAP